jgi:cytochrome c-type biogenesis protein CcmH/NrfF
MNKTTAALLAATLLALSACSNKTVIEANSGQIGAGATITQDGKTAKLHVPPSANWPKGLDATLTLQERSTMAPGVHQLLAFKTDTYQEITLTNIGEQYICHSCQSLNLPIQWHRANQ